MGLYTIQRVSPENVGYLYTVEPVPVSYAAPQKQQVTLISYITLQKQTTLGSKVHKCFNQLKKLRTIQANWDSYNAPVPTLETIERSLPFIKHCIYMNLIPDDIGASVEGGIAISFIKNEKYAAVEFYNSGEALALLSRPIDSDVWEPKLDFFGASKLIGQLKSFLG